MRTKSMLSKLAGSTCLTVVFLALSSPADARNDSVVPDPVFEDTQFLDSSPLKLAFFGGWGGRGDDIDDTIDDTIDDDSGGWGGFWGWHRGGGADDAAPAPDDDF